MANTQQLTVDFTDHERVQIRHHMGYLNVSAASSFALGVPAALQHTFMIEGALNSVIISAYDKVKQLVCRLEDIESEVYCGKDLASVNSIGDLNVNRDRLKELSQMYKMAQQGLGNLLGITPNPYDQREWVSRPMLNVPVM